MEILMLSLQLLLQGGHVNRVNDSSRCAHRADESVIPDPAGRLLITG